RCDSQRARPRRGAHARGPAALPRPGRKEGGMISYTKRQRAQAAAAVVGVDAGKYTHTLVVRPRGARDSKPHTFETTRDGFDGAVAFVRAAVPDAAPEEILVGIEFAGVYGFTLAHYLDRLGFPVVSVLPAHSKRWKE